jgi:hypothetical protein
MPSVPLRRAARRLRRKIPKPWNNAIPTPNVTDPRRRVLRLAVGGPRMRGTENQIEPIAVAKNSIQRYGWALGQALRLRHISPARFTLPTLPEYVGQGL